MDILGKHHNQENGNLLKNSKTKSLKDGSSLNLEKQNNRLKTNKGHTAKIKKRNDLNKLTSTKKVSRTAKKKSIPNDQKPCSSKPNARSNGEVQKGAKQLNNTSRTTVSTTKQKSKPTSCLNNKGVTSKFSNTHEYVSDKCSKNSGTVTNVLRNRSVGCNPNKNTNNAMQDIARLTEVDEYISRENKTDIGHLRGDTCFEKGNAKPMYKSGAVPKASNYKDKANKNQRPDTDVGSKYKDGNTNEHVIKNRKNEVNSGYLPSFHRDRIVETLKEIDQQIDSECETQPNSTNIKSVENVQKRKDKKSSISQNKSRNTYNDQKADKTGNMETDCTVDMESENRRLSGTKKIDKYFCSLSGGAPQNLPDRNVENNIAIEECTETLEEESNENVESNITFSSNQNYSEMSDVQLILGNETSENITSSQKAISEKWKQKALTKNHIEQKNSVEVQSSFSSTDVINAYEKYEQGLKLPNKVNDCLENKEAPQEDDEIIDGLSCPICYEVLHAPQKLDPCNHIFCDPCLRRMADAPRSVAAGCPMCRTEIKSCVLNNELVVKLKRTYPKQYKEREDAEHKSGVYNLPLPPTPPKLMDPFDAIENEFGNGGGIIMQIPTGQFVMIPMLPSPATVGVIIEMLELAYLTNLLQMLRQRSHSLTQLIESRRPNSTTEPLGLGTGNSMNSGPTSPFETHNYDQLEPLEPLFDSNQIRPPSSISFSHRLRPNMTERNTGTDPLDFTQFMDDVYRMFPFN